MEDINSASLGDSPETSMSLGDEQNSEAVRVALAKQRGMSSLSRGEDIEDPVQSILDSLSPSETFSAQQGQQDSADAMAAYEDGNAEPLAMQQSPADAFQMYRDYTKGLEGSDKLDDDTIDTLTLSYVTQYQLAEAWDEADAGEVSFWTGVNEESREARSTFLGSAIPWRQQNLVDDVYEKMYDLEMTSGEVPEHFIVGQFMTGSIQRRMFDYYTTLTKESKLQYIQALVKVTAESTGNPILGKTLVQNVLTGGFSDKGENVWGALDTALLPVDIASLGKLGSTVIEKLGKLSDPVSVSMRTENVEMFESLSNLARDPSASKAAGVDPTTVSAAMSPVTAKGGYNRMVHGDDIPNEIAQELDKSVQLEKQIIEEYYNLSFNTGILTPAEEATAITNAVTKLEEADPFVERLNIKTVDQDRGGFTLEFDEWRMADGDVLSKEGLTVGEKPRMRVESVSRSFNYAWNDLGELVLDDGSYTKIGFDPNTRFTGEMKELFVQGAEKNLLQVSRATQMLTDLSTNALKGIPSWGKNKIFHQLEKGGAEEKLYTYRELKHEGWSDRDIKGYFGMRRVIDTQRNMVEIEVIKLLKANQVKFWDDGTEANYQPIKSYPTSDAALTEFRSSKFDEIAVEGDIPLKLDEKGLTREELTRMENQGFSLVRAPNLLDGITIGDDVFGWAFIKKAVDPAPGRTLSRVEAYFPRSYNNERWFLKQRVPTKVKGYKGEEGSWKTLKSSDGKVGLEEWLAARAKEPNYNPKDYDILADRQALDLDGTLDKVSTYGGLFHGRRASKPIDFVSSLGRERKTTDAAAVLERMNRNSAAIMGKGLRDSTLEQKLLRSVNNKFNKEYDSLAALKKDLQTGGTFPPGAGRAEVSDAVTRLEASKGMPSDSSQTIQNWYWDLAQQLEPKNSRKGKMVPFIPHPSQLAYKLSKGEISVTDAIRGAAFTCYMGMGNTAQLIIQGSGSTVPLMANPAHFTAAMPQMIGGLIADNFLSNLTAQKKVLNWFRSNGMGDFAEGYEMWKAAGFKDATLALMDDAVGLLAKGAYGSRTFDKLKKGGTLGYVQGELMTSRAAFFTAYRKYKAENPNFDPKKFTEEDLSLITKRAEEYRLNMSKANESVLQRNLLLKVPFQFWQITHKFMTKVLPQRIPGTKISLGGTDEFTPGEKARLFFGTLIGFGGTHTLPAGEQITNYALEAFGVDAKDLTENQATMLRSGVVGILLKIGLGIGSDITTRVSLGTDFFKQFMEAFVDAELPKALLGAGSGVYERAHNGVVLTGTALAMFARDEEKLTSTDLVYLSGVALHSTLNLFSSTSAAKRYWANVFENSQDLRNTKNEFVMRSAGLNDQTAWAAFLGLAPKELTEMYEEKFRYDETDRPRGLRLDTDIRAV